MVKIEHVRHIPGHERSTFAGEWGLSLHLESAQAGGKSQYLLDFGYTPEVLIRNFELLDLDPSRIDGLILSHGHRDHYGGLEGFVTHYRAKMRPDLRLFAGGEANFREKWIKTARRRTGVLGYARPQDAGGRRRRYGVLRSPACASRRVYDWPHPLQSFERVLEYTLVEREDHGNRSPDHFTEAERLGRSPISIWTST